MSSPSTSPLASQPSDNPLPSFPAPVLPFPNGLTQQLNPNSKSHPLPPRHPPISAAEQTAQKSCVGFPSLSTSPTLQSPSLCSTPHIPPPPPAFPLDATVIALSRDKSPFRSLRRSGSPSSQSPLLSPSSPSAAKLTFSLPLRPQDSQSRALPLSRSASSSPRSAAGLAETLHPLPTGPQSPPPSSSRPYPEMFHGSSGTTTPRGKALSNAANQAFQHVLSGTTSPVSRNSSMGSNGGSAGGGNGDKGSLRLLGEAARAAAAENHRDGSCDDGAEEGDINGKESKKKEWRPWRALFFVILWFVFSTCLSLYNKFLLGSEFGNFPAPLLMTTMHFVLQFFFAGIIIKCVPKWAPTVRVSTKDYFVRVVPTAVVTAADIGLSNLALTAITLTFYTMCKATAPVFLLLFAFLFLLETPSLKLLGVMVVICVGVLLTVAGEAEFSGTGFILVMAASVMSGLRWVLIQVLLQKDKLGMTNPLVTLVYLTPVEAVVCGILSFIVEPWSKFEHSAYFGTGKLASMSIFLLVAGGVLAFLMILAEFLLIAETSALTFSVAGTVKEGLTIIVSHFVFHDKFTRVNSIGLMVMVAGVSLFNWYKLQRSAKQPTYSSEDLAEAQSTDEKQLLMTTVVDADLSQQIDSFSAVTATHSPEPHVQVHINNHPSSLPPLSPHSSLPPPHFPKSASSPSNSVSGVATSLASSIAMSAAEAVAAASSLATSVTATSSLAPSQHTLDMHPRTSNVSPRESWGGVGAFGNSPPPNGSKTSPPATRTIELLRAEGDMLAGLREKSHPMDEGYWKSLRSVATPGAAGLHERRGDDKGSSSWV